MAKIAQEIITQTGTWTAPAGVTTISVTGNYKFTDPDTVNSAFILSQQGSLYATGLNTTGRLGVGDNASKSVPTVIANTTYIKVCSSYNTGDTNYAIASTGLSFSWGANANGQMGDGTVVPKSVPTVLSGGLLFNQIKSSGVTAAGVSKNNLLYAWGINTHGQLGQGNITPLSVPTLVQGAVSFTDVVVGRDAICALSTSGQAWTVGRNTVGQLGQNLNPATTGATSSPAVIAGGLTFRAIFGGHLNTNAESFFGVTTGGLTYAWGENDNGQLGVGDTTNRSSPALVLGGVAFTRIWDTLENSTYGITSDGTLYAWGSNLYGQLGVNSITSQSSPAIVVGNLKFAYFNPGSLGQTCFGITASGDLYAWGRNQGGQLGQLTNTTNISSPALVLGVSGIKFARVINVGASVLGFTTDGAIYAWGQNANGECGLGDTTARSSPTLLAGAIMPQIVTPSEAPFPSSVTLTVIPGTAYNIVFSTQYSTLGGNQVAYGELDSLTITYEQ